LSLDFVASPPLVPADGICASATWNQNGVTVAGGNGRGTLLNQLHEPLGLFVDGNDAVYVVDTLNNRVVKWASGVPSGQLVAGGNGEGSQTNQMLYATKLVVDEKGAMFICDHENKRVQQWFKNSDHGQTIIENISCWGLAMDNEGSLYVSEWDKLSVIKWPSEQVVAGGNGAGPALNQLSYPCGIFVDQDQSVFVADNRNHRIVKWSVGAKEGVIVAGYNLIQSPQSVIVDRMGTVYVVDYANHITRWLKGSTSGSIIIGGQGGGSETAQLSDPTDLVFDRRGNLYVVDRDSNRIQMFAIDKSSCGNATYKTSVIH
jgi:sugar lactone lactonase YvrE